ncbi:MAG: AAA family ATPase [Thermoleophilia bacterium]|nr:AAA family ATPase [Thermoleophilia bacterium]
MTDPTAEQRSTEIAGGAVERAFLIADVRGYTRFTREHGDAAAAQLARSFAELARDAVEARGGRVIELRGDEALAVFDRASQAVRAAAELVAGGLDETAADPTLPLLVGVGIDVGEAVPVDGGFRGLALNTAARLCARASAGQVLVTRRAALSAGESDGLRLAPAGTAALKGFDAPVEVIEVLADGAPRPARKPHADRAPPLPIGLDADPPLAGRARELAWLRGSWRQAQRGRGRLVVLSGPAGIGKTRLAAEVAAFAHARGAAVAYAGAGGAAAALAVSALRDAAAADAPTLLVLDDLDAVADAVAGTASELLDSLGARPALAVMLVRDPHASRALAELVERVDRDGDAHRRLGPLALEDVREIAALYAPDGPAEVPVESIARASRGAPGRAHELLSEWAEAEATRRLAAAAEFLAAERRERRADLQFANTVIGRKLARLYGAENAVADVLDACPYKGLAPFDERDAAVFFGRERLVGELAARTVGAGLLAVVGASGSGKSSLVAAGLVPSLRAGLLPGSERWTPVTIRPGAHPLRELDALRPDPRGERVVLVVDQFEELFTLCEEEAERARFVERLVELAAEPERVVVVLTLRGDFYGHCAAYAELAELVAGNQVLVGPMSADELRRAIELPARRAGVRVESPLVEALVAEVGEEAGVLPLLSTALVELWLERRDGWLRREARDRLGGVSGAVARLADTAYEHLDDGQREATRRLFLRLVTSGDDSTVVRRRVPLPELDLERDPVLAAVVERLVADRLLTAHERAVEIAHEALIGEWPRLQAWLLDDAQGRELREQLTHSARRWHEQGRDAADLYRGARLSATLDWAAGREAELNELEREFLTASRGESELELVRQRRLNRRLKGLLAGAGGLLVLAVLAGALALGARSDAEDSATAAVAQRLGAQALVVEDIDLSLLLARQGVELEGSQQTLANLQSALVRSPAAIRVARPLAGRLLSVGVSDDGRLLGYSSNAGQLAFVDARTGRARRVVEGDGWGFTSSPDAVIVARGSDDGLELIRVDLRTGAEQRHGTVPKGPDDFFSISDDNRLWALRRRDSANALIGDVRTGRPLRELRPLAGAPPLVDVNFRGRYLVTSSPKGPPTPTTPVRFDVWRTGTWRHVATVESSRGGLLTLPAVDRAGRRFAVGYDDGSVHVWDLRTGTSRQLNGRHTAAVQGVGFSPDGATLVSTGDDTEVLVWDVETGELRQTLSGHAGRVLGPGFSRDGETVYTAGLDGAAITWDLRGSRRLGRPFRAGRGVLGTLDEGDRGPSFALSRDGRRLAAAQGNGRVAVVELASGRRLFETSSIGGALLDVTWSPDGRELAGAGTRGRVATWDADDGRLRRSFRGIPATLPPQAREPRLANPMNDVQAVIYSPDGRVLAASSSDGRVFRWDTRTGRTLGRPFGAEEPAVGNAALDLAFSPDGERLAAAFAFLPGAGGTGVVWRLADGKELYRTDIDGWYGRGSAVAFSPDGRLLATGGGTGEIKFWDARDGERRGRTLTGISGWVLSLAFDPTGRVLVSGGSDGSVRLWDVERRAPFGSPLPGLDNTWVHARFTPAGDRLAVVYAEGSGFVWPMTPSSWKEHACTVAARTLTPREWELYLPDRPYRPACR